MSCPTFVAIEEAKALGSPIVDFFAGQKFGSPCLGQLRLIQWFSQGQNGQKSVELKDIANSIHLVYNLELYILV